MQLSRLEQTHTNTQTDRQTERQAGRQTNRQTDRQTDRQAGRQADKRHVTQVHPDTSNANRLTRSYTGSQLASQHQPDRQTDTDRPTDRRSPFGALRLLATSPGIHTGAAWRCRRSKACAQPPPAPKTCIFNRPACITAAIRIRQSRTRALPAATSRTCIEQITICHQPLLTNSDIKICILNRPAVIMRLCHCSNKVSGKVGHIYAASSNIQKAPAFQRLENLEDVLYMGLLSCSMSRNSAFEWVCSYEACLESSPLNASVEMQHVD